MTTGDDAQHNNDTLICGYYPDPFSLVVYGGQSELALQYMDSYSYSNGFSVSYLGLAGSFIGIKQINQSIYSIGKD